MAKLSKFLKLNFVELTTIPNPAGKLLTNSLLLAGPNPYGADAMSC
jgi:hypothetical protein